MARISVSSIFFILLQILRCIPIDAVWRSWKGDYPIHYRCFDVNSLVCAVAGCSIAQGLTILVLPLLLTIGLNTSWHRKAAIVVMFSLGIFALVTSCSRLRYLIMFARKSLKGIKGSFLGSCRRRGEGTSAVWT